MNFYTYKNIVKFLILFSFQLSFAIPYSQEPLHYVIGKDEFDGTTIYSIIEDKEHGIWISSSKGLHYYNGLDFTFFKPISETREGLFNLTKDNNGTIYCCNLSGDIFKVTHSGLKLFYSLPKGSILSSISFNFDNNNNLIIISGKNTFIVRKNKSVIIKKNTGLFLTKKNDTIFYGKHTVKGGYQIIGFHNEREYIIQQLSYLDIVKNKYHTPIERVYRLNNKFYFFVYVKKKLYELSNNRVKEITLPFTNNNHNLIFFEDKKTNFWFFDFKKGTYKVPYQEIESCKNAKKWFKDYSTKTVISDHEENIWIGTENKGLIVIPKKTLNTTSYNLSDKTITGLSKINRKLYISTLDNSIYELQNKNFVKTKQLPKNERLYYFYHNPKKQLTITNENAFLKNKIILGVGFNRKSIIHNDDVYFATSSRVIKYNLNTNKESTLTNGRAYDISLDTLNNTLWINNDKGVYQYIKGEQKPVTYNNEKLIYASFLNINNDIWLNTKYGVLIFKNNNIINTITTKDGLLTNQNSIIRYEKPFLYLVSSKGIQQYNTNTKKIKTITKSDGFVNNISNFEVLNDTVYAITQDKLLSFSFNQLDSLKIPEYQTQIVTANVNGNTKINNGIKLNPDENNIDFSFTTSSYKYKNIKYIYQLIGFEKKPINAKSNYVNYSNLPAGKYTFKVDSFINDHKNKPAFFRFEITKHWYQTTLFKIITIIIVLAMIYIIYRIRIRAVIQKRDKEELKKRLAESSLTSLKAQMNPHFLFNSINSIQSLILEHQNDEAYQYLTQLANLVRENLQMSDVSFVPFTNELKLINKYLELEKLRFEDTFTYSIKNFIDDIDVLVPSMIIQPFIENAIKHGLLHRKNNRQLHIGFKKNNNVITCIIQDNGIGREASSKLKKQRKYKSFSTNAIEKRFNILKEYYKIDIGFSYEDLYRNDIALGTRVTINIPFSDEFNF